MRVPQEQVVILGIDPGLANTGWGVVLAEGSRCRCLAYGCITTKSGVDLAERLKDIHDQMAAVVRRYHPTEVGIESVYFGANTQSAFATGQARGAALVATAAASLKTGEYTPMQIKQAVVGTGSADKNQVQYMVRTLLGLDHDVKPDHSADALAAAVCHAHMRLSRALDASALLSAELERERGRASNSALLLHEREGR